MLSRMVKSLSGTKSQSPCAQPSPPGKAQTVEKPLSNFNRAQRHVRWAREDFCGGKSHFPEQKSFPCSFCARKPERFQQKLVGVANFSLHSTSSVKKEPSEKASEGQHIPLHRLPVIAAKGHHVALIKIQLFRLRAAFPARGAGQNQAESQQRRPNSISHKTPPGFDFVVRLFIPAHLPGKSAGNPENDHGKNRRGDAPAHDFSNVRSL